LSKDTDPNENNSPSRQNVLDIIESFINGIVVIRRTLVGFSLSALFLAPFAIALSLYLMFHPSFFSVLQGHGDFGMYLVMLLVSIVVISLAWIALGIRQYRVMGTWSKGYREYIGRKEWMDKRFSSQFNLEDM
jgi:hypothetical protein